MIRNYVFFVFFIAFNAHAQFYNFKNFSVDQGLAESKINTLCEDRRGNLWIGTDGAGLFRYDGYTFHNYRQEDGLLHNVVHTIHEDHTGKLWIGSEEGICTYNGIRFTTFSHLEKEAITAILQDASLNLWFGTRNKGLYKFNGNTLIPFTTTKKGLVDGTINCLYIDNESNVWIGTPHGIGRYNKHNFKFYTTVHGLSSTNVIAITQDHQGKILIATTAGISQWKGESFTDHAMGNKIKNNDIHALMCDNKNNLWIGSSGGISKYDGETVQHYNPTIGQRNNTIICIYQDKQGNLWFGSSENGVSKLDSERFSHYPENDQMGKRVYSIIQAINGNFICGTSLGGTTVFDGKHYALLDNREGFTSSIVQCFYYSPDSTLWVGTEDEGVYKFSKTGVQQFTVKEGLISNNITGFTVDMDSVMWIATADSGVAMIQTDDSLHIKKKYNSANGFPSNKISTITCDHTGILWVGTEDKGVVQIRPSKNGHEDFIHITMDNGLSSNTIHAMVEDSKGHMYVGTSRGINIFNDKNIFPITKAQGLGSHTVYSLTFDRKGNLWAGTDRGVDMITFTSDLTSPSIRHFGSNEGFKGVEVYRNSSCMDRDGNIWFGTINGLVRYNPEEEIKANVPPNIHLTGIKLFFDRIEDTPYGDSTATWYSIPAQLTLPYHQNNLTFSFVGIHHRDPQAVRYKWILEGFSNDWSPPITEREATFSNLPPGDYVFKVKACNEFNVWSESPASFMFSITPPFWQKWWARLAGLGIIVALVWTLFHIRIQRIEEKNRIVRERLEMEKNILELEQEAARLQMNPHFIFNCLNSIQGFISTNNSLEAKKYLAKFARLMRLILENAREEFIPLQNEMHILENYLELEKLSTNHAFDFTIIADDSIDPESIEIPPMMIQPFVENAIIHGLKRKEHGGFINITFHVKDDLLVCTVHDNGIGRKKAAENKGKTSSNHKSTGISVTQQRLEQYCMHRKVKAGVAIIDLEENGVVLGTKVIISTPFEMH